MADEDQDVVFVPEPDHLSVSAAEAQAQAQSDAAELAEDIEQLHEIKTDLQDLKQLTGSNKAWFFRGVLQGAGAIIGSIAMLIVLGWLLSILGVIPGAAELSTYISAYMDKVGR